MLYKPKYTIDDERNQVLAGYEKIGVINADIQPCKGEVKAQLYGKEITKYLTVYMNLQSGIEEGLYIELDGKYYEIQVIERWHTHMVFDIKVVS